MFRFGRMKCMEQEIVGFYKGATFIAAPDLHYRKNLVVA
jgi:hypothetical protein